MAQFKGGDNIDFGALAERMMRAGWINQFADSKEAAALTYTTLGEGRLKELREILDELDRETITAKEWNALGAWLILGKQF